MPFKLPADQRCALISRAIEIDLRDFIKEKILPYKNLKDFAHENIINRIKERIDKDQNIKDYQQSDKINDYEIVDYFDFGTSLEIIKSNKDILDKKNSIVIKSIIEDLIKIKPVRDFSIHGRVLLASHLDIIDTFVESLKKDREIIFETTIKQIESLKDKTILDSYDYEPIDEREHNHNLPRPDTNETGYIERLELNQKINKVLNNYPVISFIGDAGTGKTATAIKKGYDLLQEDKFDVVWYHTFKTEKFSVGEVRQIKNDINTSDKFLFNYLKVGDYDKDPIKNLVKYLEKNKVLLILDNLETVIDQNIESFLDYFAEAVHESKIILTSRVPVNRGDMVIKVGSFKEKEAIDYFRKLLSFYDLNNLQSLDEKTLKKLVKQRNYNPLFLKLSVGAISGGKTIEDAFKEDTDLLNFCYMNVFETLDDVSKKVLEYSYYLNRELNLSDICMLLEGIDPKKVSLSLRDLVAKNFITSSFTKSETSYFIIRKEIVPFIKANNFFKDRDKKNQLFEKFTKMMSATYHIKVNIDKINELKEDWDSYLVRRNTDKFAAQQLKTAGKIMKKKQMILSSVAYKKESLSSKQRKDMDNFDNEFFKVLNNIKRTHPDYCEIYRVEAIYHHIDRNITDLITCYEKAIELQPDYPNLRTFYATALRQVQDLDNALRVAKDNYELYPNRLSAIENLLLAKQFTGTISGDEIQKLISKIKSLLDSNTSNQSDNERRKSAMRVISSYQREASIHSRNRDYDKTFESIKKLFKTYDEFKSIGLVDYFTVYTTINKSRMELKALGREWRNREEAKEIHKMNQKIIQEFKEFPNLADRRRTEVNVGGEYYGRFFLSNTNHLAETGGGYISLNDSFIKEHEVVTFKIYIREKDLPEEIKKLKGTDKNGKQLKFKATKVFAPRKKEYFIIAAEAKVVDYATEMKKKEHIKKPRHIRS